MLEYPYSIKKARGMKHIFKFIFLLIFFVAGGAQADLYTAESVEMSGEGASPVEAKNNAIMAGELKAFDQVMKTLVGPDNQVFVTRPSEDEILGYVRDISILEEKNTSTSYWGKMNVRFKESALQDLLKQNNQVYLKKAPLTYWVIPVFKQGAETRTLEDENPFYQLLKAQNKLSDTFQMILPNGDVAELIAVEHALAEGDFSGVQSMAHQNGAENILVVEVVVDPYEKWEMKPVSYTETENIFSDIVVQEEGLNTLWDGWQRLNQKMNQKWQEQYRSDLEGLGKHIYYARYKIAQVSGWYGLEKELSRLGFLENLKLQGAMPGQLLIAFEYQKSINELQNQFEKAGFIWQPDSATVGTLKRKEFYENTL